MCKRDGRYKLCGITSGGNQVCDSSNTDPTFFTSTPAASLMMWIRENIKTVGEPKIIWKLERSNPSINNESMAVAYLMPYVS